MRFEYRRQLSDGTTRTSRLSGWLAAIVGALIFIGLAALFVFVIIPFALIGILIFIATVLLFMFGGWLWVSWKIGFRNLWDLTKMAFQIRRGGDWRKHYDRLRTEWDSKSRGRSGEWH